MSLLPRMIAHRGVSYAAPENTLASIALSWDEQADGVEIDIHLTADDHIVAIHDDTLLRTAGLDAPVADTPLAVIKTLDAGSWKSPAYAGERVPTLDEVLQALPAGRQLVIEIKSHDPALPTILAETLHRGPVPMQSVVLISFDAPLLRQASLLLPDVTSLHVAGKDRQREDAPSELEALIDQATALGFHGLNLSRQWPWDAAMVQRIHHAGLSCWVWTVNNPAQALHLARCGVDGLTSDRPLKIRQYLVAHDFSPQGE